MATKTDTAEKTRKPRGKNRPLRERLVEAIATEQKRIEYHEKHLDEAKANLRTAQKALEEHDNEVALTADERLKELEAEMKLLQELKKNATSK
ncbi:hypothetical protein [Leifsonia sp. TF02-11]|uniref:hypothetical protein n=1 Tax=Leifsonia sp. TF02-11 TaxID=2815212 RepID=UPI001AA0B59A|nr:hypothetical protein [Leifsonia sp. TF02-11]MBO1739796.1 hypothetical protein [Leifsonia sp. TF02-11]